MLDIDSYICLYNCFITIFKKIKFLSVKIFLQSIIVIIIFCLIYQLLLFYRYTVIITESHNFIIFVYCNYITRLSFHCSDDSIFLHFYKLLVYFCSHKKSLVLNYCFSPPLSSSFESYLIEIKNTWSWLVSYFLCWCLLF